MLKKILHNLIQLCSGIIHNGGYGPCKIFPVRHNFTYFYLAILNLIQDMERTKSEKLSTNLAEGQLFDIFSVPLKRDTVTSNFKQHQNLPPESNIRLIQVFLYLRLFLHKY